MCGPGRTWPLHLPRRLSNWQRSAPVKTKQLTGIKPSRVGVNYLLSVRGQRTSSSGQSMRPLVGSKFLVLVCHLLVKHWATRIAPTVTSDTWLKGRQINVRQGKTEAGNHRCVMLQTAAWSLSQLCPVMGHEVASSPAVRALNCILQPWIWAL